MKPTDRSPLRSKSRAVFAAAAVVCSAVNAQSSVTIFGVIDAGVARISGTGAGHATSLVSGGNSTPRLGFRGREELGSDLAAGFQIEGQLNNDVGGGATQTTGFDFARRATVSLFSKAGELRIGRDYAIGYLTYNQFDVFNQRGIGMLEVSGNSLAGVGAYSRVSNSIAYFLPDGLGGLYGGVQYAFGEQQSDKAAVANAAGISTSAANATTNKTGNYYGGRIGYTVGRFDASTSYGVFQDAVRAVGTSFYADDYKIFDVGARYDFGFIAPRISYQREQLAGRGGIADFKLETYALGATAPLGPGLVRAQIARYNVANSANDFSKAAVGYMYNLSKRTVLYADLARLKNGGAGTMALTSMSSSARVPRPVAGGSSTGYTVGVRHNF